MPKKKSVTFNVTKQLEDIEIELDEAMASLDDTSNRIDDMIKNIDTPDLVPSTDDTESEDSSVEDTPVAEGKEND
ncbi:MAG: hypothetical protein COA73_07950 [Candidatus Hydrogenedentota bacterium]|nr:MAG: hypothetical protein COA73_07950 [Candidatus Hydrogenedentota bacterium]